MKKATVKKCILIILEVLFAAILLLNVATAVLSRVDLRTRLDVAPFALLTVDGGSMSPALDEGHLLVVRRYAYEALSVGDDITFMTSDGLVTHRIVAVSQQEYVTRGLSNEVDDLYTVSSEEYCGKVVGTVPYLGYAVHFLASSPFAMALCICLILLLSFGGLVLRLLKAARKQEEGRPITSLPCRVLACFSALSMLLCLPYFTDAKYTGQINRFELAVADALHFSSNYLAKGSGTTYNIQGWDGTSETFNLDICNYDNELLYNEENVDVRYGLGIKINEAYNTDYEIQVVIPDSLEGKEVEDFAYPESWGSGEGGKNITHRYAYELKGGDKQKHQFKVNVIPTTASGELPGGTDICFEVYATTEIGKTYAVELKGTFRLHVAEATTFIGRVDAPDSASMVSLNVKTNLIPGDIDERVLLFSWDPEYLYLNEFESTAFNIIQNHPDYFQKGNGYLWMKAQAYANIKLEFFKKVPPETEEGEEPIVPDYSITVMLVEQIGSTEAIESKTTAQVTPEPEPENP